MHQHHSMCCPLVAAMLRHSPIADRAHHANSKSRRTAFHAILAVHSLRAKPFPSHSLPLPPLSPPELADALQRMAGEGCVAMEVTQAEVQDRVSLITGEGGERWRGGGEKCVGGEICGRRGLRGTRCGGQAHMRRQGVGAVPAKGHTHHTHQVSVSMHVGIRGHA